MHDDVRLLVEDDQVVVFVEDLERNVLRRDLVRRRGWENHLDPVSQAESGARLGRTAVDPDGVLVDEPLQRGPAHEGNAIDEIAIQSLLEITGQFEVDRHRRVVVLTRLVQPVERLAIDLSTGIEQRPLRRGVVLAHGDVDGSAEPASSVDSVSKNSSRSSAAGGV